MRMRTLILVLALTLTAGLVYANGTTGGVTPAGPGTGPEVETAPPPTVEPEVETAPEVTTPPEMAPPPTTTTTAPAPVCPTSADLEQFNRNFVSRYYNLNESTVSDLRQRYDWGTVYFIANLSARTGRPVTEIASLIDQGVSCSDIAARYNIVMSDLTTPVIATTRVAGTRQVIVTSTTVMTPVPFMTDRYGNVILSATEDRRLKRMGYTWQDIAIAANVSAQTGYPVYEVIRWTEGMTWNSIALQYGLDIDEILDTSSYPFPRSDEGLPERPIGAGVMTQPEMTAPSPATAPTY